MGIAGEAEGARAWSLLCLGPGKTNASVHGTTASEDPSRLQPGLLRVAALASGAADEGKGSSRQHARARLTQLQVGLPPLNTVADKAGFRKPYLHVLPRSPLHQVFLDHPVFIF